MESKKEELRDRLVISLLIMLGIGVVSGGIHLLLIFGIASVFGGLLGGIGIMVLWFAFVAVSLFLYSKYLRKMGMMRFIMPFICSVLLTLILGFLRGDFAPVVIKFFAFCEFWSLLGATKWNFGIKILDKLDKKWNGTPDMLVADEGNEKERQKDTSEKSKKFNVRWW